jgi:hypothetical protein
MVETVSDSKIVCERGTLPYEVTEVVGLDFIMKSHQ